ncbi:hypothetical protein [Kribbella sp. NPDC006257]|uniref:hypothetical protein n=1 Tax=Kribbella sp. NPDC006257 TaxID=3156738 RepID=UPI0033B2AD8B
MKQKNGRLIVLVAAIAVLAVITGGVIASQRGPQKGDNSAAPLAGQTTTPVAKTPTATPSTPSPSATPSSGGAVNVSLKLSKLRKGRDPQVPYLVGREVRGGAGAPTKIPGTAQIQEVARVSDSVLAVVSKGYGTELLTILYDKVEHTPDVTSLVTTADGRFGAYATKRIGSDGGGRVGSTVYATVSESDLSVVKKLELPNRWEVSVLAYQDGKVYYRAYATQNANTWQLYAWDPAKSSATEVKTVTSPTALSGNGKLAASMTTINDNGTCSMVTEVATGKSLWRTCANRIGGFTEDGATAYGGPAVGDGYADLSVSALDTKAGAVIREWGGGPSFRQTVAEDDQHLLILADDGHDTKAAIIRCTVTDGQCELATPLATGELMIGS